MPMVLDKVKPFTLMRTKLQYPLDYNDRLHGSVVFMLTKDIQDTIDFLNNNTILENHNTFLSYYTEKDYTFYLEDSSLIDEDNDTRKSIIESVLESDQGEIHPLFNNSYLMSGNTKTYYPDLVEQIATNEDFQSTQNYPLLFRNYLYKERIKNQKGIVKIFDKIKKEVPFIKYTYLSLPLYRRRNIIIDWAYYANLFFKNNTLQLDKGVDLVHHMMTRLIEDTRINDLQYTRKTVIIPIHAWCKDNDTKKLFDYKQDLNPFSMIFRLIRKKNVLSDYWNNTDFIIASNNAYFKLDFTNFTISSMSRIILLTEKLIHNDLSDAVSLDGDNDNTPANKESNSKQDIEKDNTDTTTVNGKTVSTSTEVISKVSGLATPVVEKEISTDTDEEWLQSVLTDLDTPPITEITPARQARMEELDKQFGETIIADKKVKDILANYYSPKEEELKPHSIPIDSINEDWKKITSLDFNKSYDINKDIVAIMRSLRYKSRPLSIVKMEMKDTSTYEDYVYTLTAVLEDINGIRSTINIDIPKFINNRLMLLRGNKKQMSGQLMLMPIIKTDENVVQIVTSYNKIRILRVNPYNGAKTTKAVHKLVKTLSSIREDEESKSSLKIFMGDNAIVCMKYDLPIEYRDLSGLFSRIDIKDGSYVTFNMDDASKLVTKSSFDKTKNIIIGYDAKTKQAVYCPKDRVAISIADFLKTKDTEFGVKYDTLKFSNKLSYSKASIMNSDIPIIVLMAFSEGLQKSMDKAKIQYSFSEKRPKTTIDTSFVKFNDGYLVYNDSKPEDSLLMTGLTKCNTEDYSIKDINSKKMWLDMLDIFGGRIKADGLDNFYDCEFDPMSIDICKQYNLPYDYVEALAYASKLLVNSGFNEHSDIRGNRIRTNEVVAGYFYKVLMQSYGEYANKSKHTGRGIKFTIKQDALILALMQDPGFSDLSISTPLLEAESMNTMSFKGLSGMNADRAYTLDKRIYDKSMLGVLGMTTGFSGNVGITRPATVNTNIKTSRGIIEPQSEKELNTLSGLTIYEALTPYTTTHDDPMREAMGYIQTTKHQMRVKSSSPSLITTGMDEALPYFTGNLFSYKFKGVKGKVLKVTDELLLYEEIDENKEKHVRAINLSQQVMKNSDGGFYVVVHLKPTVKVGQSLKYDQILAYDPTSFSDCNAKEKNQSNISYNSGTMAKIAIMCTDEAFEDSSIIDERLSDAMTSFYCVEKSCSLDAQSNVFDIATKGQSIEEGNPLIIFQNAFEDEDANTLLKNISDDELELVSDFGRIQVRSKLTGVVQDIKMYRTCELEDMSPSMRKIVSAYERAIKAKKNELKKAGVSDLEINEMIEPTEKMEPEGKLKNTLNGVLFTFYIRCEDIMGVGDKLIYNTAIKGVIKDIMPKGKEPYTDFRKDEKIDALLTSSSVNARMAVSIFSTGMLNKVLIELTRQCKDKLGIKWDYLSNKDNLNNQ